ncbi:pyrroline-5-carboxylate reductase [Pollutimonas harenae]|uniref:Pyrroline-5-carboxylate reductase n=1 Tax=Pollutimonas harenae TaxID=657015 RepID=A0A853H0X3_9BURK|nr:pyrroline-5-carboxylate reductase [Pollutimonas harenae]NYT85972.1 pyrroline-5-carboxylate reductase [Pollutimonas harenae]TEA71021.1 pyrroline-5-carboxylate reductase [Pollutimonas harenae]
MNQELTIAFIGGGNMASALAAGLIGKRCGAHDVHVIDINQAVLDRWAVQGTTVSQAPDDMLARRRLWILAVKPQYLKEAVMQCRPFLQEDTLVVSIAAGISAETLSSWLGSDDKPFTRIVRCMPNTPALIGAGASGLLALPGVSEDDKTVVQQCMRAVGEVTWVDTDAQIDAVTALSGSGPAYVFLFIEALIQGGIKQGLDEDQARTLALATVTGATQLAALSHESLQILRERVTSKGGTTAAALDVLQSQNFPDIVQQAMLAAYTRAAELSSEFAQ